MFYAIRYLSPLASLVAFFLRRNRDPSACRTRLSIDPAIDPALMRHVRDQSATERRGRKSRRVCSGVGNQKHFPILVYGYVTRGCGLPLTPPPQPPSPPAAPRGIGNTPPTYVTVLPISRRGEGEIGATAGRITPPARLPASHLYTPR